MNKEIKEKWLKALRSGEYKQGTGTLRSGNEFCCLGVLADVAYDGEWAEDVDRFSYLKHKNGTLNPNFVPCRLLGKARQEDLAEMNDTGLSFEQIANWIEASL